jgi:hypothetical protein
MAMLLPWLWKNAREFPRVTVCKCGFNKTDKNRIAARGLMSGILQQGYSLGYVFAACANLGVGGGTESWKTVFWIAGESSENILAACSRTTLLT